MANLLEAEAPAIQEEELGGLVVGNEEVNASVTVKVVGDDAKTLAGPVNDSRLGRNIDEMPTVIAEEVIGHRREFRRPTKGEYFTNFVPALRVGVRCPT